MTLLVVYACVVSVLAIVLGITCTRLRDAWAAEAERTHDYKMRLYASQEDNTAIGRRKTELERAFKDAQGQISAERHKLGRIKQALKELLEQL